MFSSDLSAMKSSTEVSKLQHGPRSNLTSPAILLSILCTILAHSRRQHGVSGTVLRKCKDSTKLCPSIPTCWIPKRFSVSGLPKHRPVGCRKIPRLVKLAYRGVCRMAKESTRHHKLSLGKCLGKQGNNFCPKKGEQLFHALASRYPKYSPILQTLPLLFEVLSSETKESRSKEQKEELLKIGVKLMGHWLAES